MFLSVVMCMKVYWRHADVVLEAGMAVVPVSADVGSGPSSQEQPRVRVEFPETWLWSESSTGYHLTPDVIYAAKFGLLSCCFCSKLSPVLHCHFLAVFNEKSTSCSIFGLIFWPCCTIGMALSSSEMNCSACFCCVLFTLVLRMFCLR